MSRANFDDAAGLTYDQASDCDQIADPSYFYRLFPMTPPANTNLLAQLQQLTAGLYFVTEADAPLDAVSYPAPRGELPGPELLRTLGEPADAPVQVSPLGEFLRYHTDPAGGLDSLELASRYQALQAFLQQNLAPVQVYRIGSEPRLHAYVLGKLPDGQLAGFKTVLTQT